MSLPRNHPTCGVCTHKLVKNGKTSAGRTRWRCKTCGASTTQTRTDTTRKAEFARFHAWLEGKQNRGDYATSTRTFTRHTQWCWNVEPHLTPTGQIHDQIMLDGTYLNGWCALIAHSGTHVIGWQWTDTEKIASWTALIERIPPPIAAIIDGNGPLATTISRHWPDTRIQRCLFHLQQTGHRHLTRQPKLPANKELLALYRALTPITNLDEAAAWTAAFTSWEAKWERFLKHRSYAKTSAFRPAHVRPGQAWWYTHLRTRRAWRALADVLRRGHLFTWLELAEDGYHIGRMTSPLEGGPNTAIKNFLRNHRGLSIKHARRGIDWLLYKQTEHPQEPWAFVTPQAWQTSTRPQAKVSRSGREETELLYDTAFSSEDGNGIQKGWGGRSR